MLKVFGVTDDQLRKWVANVGVPSVIALWLVWTLTTSLSGAITTHAAQTTHENEATIKLLRLICVGVASDTSARAECQR